MPRAVAAFALLTAAALLAAAHPMWLAALGGIVAAFGVMCGGLIYYLWRHHSVVQWGKFAGPEKCLRCKGWGVLKLDRTPFQQDPHTMAHVLWTRGNKRDCPDCKGLGHYTPRRPLPGPTTRLQPDPDGEPDLLFPGGPDTISPTRIIPPPKDGQP